MAKKKIQIDEPTPYDAQLEQHVDELLAPERKSAPSKKIAITHHGEEVTKTSKKVIEPLPKAEAEALEPEESPAEDLSTAPLLPDAPVPKEPLKISVFHHETETPNVSDDSAESAKIKSPKKVATSTVDDTPSEPATAVADEPEIDIPGLPINELEQAEEDPEAIKTITLDGSSDPEFEVTPEAEPEFAVEEQEETPLPEEYNDDRIEALVSDIVAKEGDELLAAEDERAGRIAPTTVKPKKPRKSSLTLIKLLLTSSAAKVIAVLLVLAVLGVAVGMPKSRYFVLNNVGVRSSASVTVIDHSTQQPLKNVTVKLADQIGQTDDNGVVRLQKLRLGPTQLSIEKRAFAPITKTVTLGWGSNPMTGFELEPTGSQYSFIITDYLSGKPVAAASAVSEYADANADEKGVIKLTLDKSAKDVVDVTITSSGYRDEHVSLNPESKLQIPVKMVSARKHAYVSKRSGKFDLYKIDIDGKNEQVVLAGTGNERSDMVIASSPTQNVVAVVSTREPARNKDGYLLSTLTIVDLDTSNTVKISQSEQIHLIGWNGGRLAYIQIASGTSAANPDRERLMSYDYAKRDNKQITSANYFNDVLAIGDYIYYAPTGGNSDPSGNFTRVKFDGSDKKAILVGETWNAFRSDYEHIVLSVPGAWYQHVIGSANATKLDGQPGNTSSRVYIDSPDGKHSLWVDKRDGKGVLLNYDVAGKKDETLLAKGGIGYPIKWLDAQTVVYRVNTEGETADYALSLNGGEPRKLHDVTTTGSNDRWYYY